jgi:hypothetical protein
MDLQEQLGLSDCAVCEKMQPRGCVMLWRCILANQHESGSALETGECMSMQYGCDVRKGESPLWRREALTFECDDIG